MPITGDGQIAVTLSEGNADFPYLMSDPHLGICPAKPDGSIDWQSGIGTGGYVLKSFDPGVRTVTTIYLPCVALEIGLVVAFIEIWGARGAATALLVGAVLYNVLLTVAARRALRDDERRPRADARAVAAGEAVTPGITISGTVPT